MLRESNKVEMHQILNGIFYVNFAINFKQVTNLEINPFYKPCFSLQGDNFCLKDNGSQHIPSHISSFENLFIKNN